MLVFLLMLVLICVIFGPAAAVAWAGINAVLFVITTGLK